MALWRNLLAVRPICPVVPDDHQGLSVGDALDELGEGTIGWPLRVEQDTSHAVPRRWGGAAPFSGPGGSGPVCQIGSVDVQVALELADVVAKVRSYPVTGEIVPWWLLISTTTAMRSSPRGSTRRSTRPFLVLVKVIVCSGLASAPSRSARNAVWTRSWKCRPRVRTLVLGRVTEARLP